MYIYIMIVDNMCHISPSTLFGSFHDGLHMSQPDGQNIGSGLEPCQAEVGHEFISRELLGW